MRRVVLLLVCVVALEAVTHKVGIKNTGSLRKKLIESGNYFKFLSQHLKNKASGKMPFLDYFDEFYLGNITLGTPPQTLQIVLDTGSSDMWIIGIECGSEACKGYPASGYTKHRFDTGKSKTFVKIGDRFALSYLEGSCEGYTATDTLRFANFEIPKQLLGVATEIADTFGYQPIDGLMGLAWPSLAEFDTTPPMQNLLPNLDKKLFSVWLERSVDISSGGSGGTITFGDLDPTNCNSKINYVPLTSKTYWQFSMDGFTIGSYSTNKAQQVISDTGNSFICGPTPYITEIVKEAGGTPNYDLNMFTIPCSKQKSAPSLVLKINNIDYTIEPIEYIIDLNLGHGLCAMAVVDMETGGFGPAWILGDTFIRAYCQIYDVGNGQIGFAKSNQKV